MILSIISPVIVAGFVMANGYPGTKSLFMKGRVAAPHAYMENKCGECHVPWQGVSNRSCIKCHVDDRHYLAKDTDRTIAKNLRCFDCHQEHRGRSYDLAEGEYFTP